MSKSTTKISKWGNGYAIRIPIALMEKLHMIEGSEINLKLIENGIQITPNVDSIKNMSLSQILSSSKLTDFRDYSDDYFGVPSGDEIW